MGRRSFIRFTHKADILSKTFSTNDTGQRFPVWSMTHENAECFATAAGMRATIRITPTTEQADWITLFLPYDTAIAYGSRIKDISYKSEIIHAGTYEVQQIDPAPSFSGRPMYNVLTIKSVIE